MGSSFLCNIVYTYGMLKFAWQSFKILKSSSQLTRLYSLAQQNSTFLHNLFFNNEKLQVETLKQLIETKNTEMKHSLQFWTVFSSITLFDYYVEPFISFWLPFYFTIKFAFLLWIVIPETKGADVVFSQFVAPWLRKHESYIDNTFLPLCSGWFTKMFGFLDTAMFSTVSKSLLTDEQIDQLCAQYEERIAELAKEKKLRPAKPFLPPTDVKSSLSSSGTGFKASAPLSSPDSATTWTESVSALMFSKSSSPTTNIETKTSETKNDVSSWFGFATEGIVSLAVNTKNALSTLQTSLNTKNAKSDVGSILNNNVVELNNLVLEQEKYVETKVSSGVGNKPTAVNNENRNQGSSSEDFENLLDEFDEEDIAMIRKKNQHDDDNDSDSLDVKFDFSGVRKKDRNNNNNTGNRLGRFATDKTGETVLSYSDDSDENNSSEGKEVDGLRYRGKGGKKDRENERMSLHRPKKYNTRAQDRRN